MRRNSKFYLYEIVYDNNTYTYTNSNKDQLVEGVLYESEYISHSDITYSVDYVKNDIKMTLPLINKVPQIFISGEIKGRINLTIIEYDGESKNYIFNGEITDLLIRDNEVEFTAKTLTSKLSRVANRYTYQSSCNHQLFDPKCGVNEELHVIDAVVVSAELGGTLIKLDKIAPNGTSEYMIDKWALNGKIVLIKNNQSQMIVSVNKENNTINTLNITSAKNGDKLKVYAGCNKTISDCRNKFNNEVNILADTAIPNKNPFVTLFD